MNEQKNVTHAWYAVGVADTLLEEPVPDLPGEDGRTLALVVRYALDDVVGRHAGLRPADGARPYRPRLVVPAGDRKTKERR
jgi:hypothetical protein